MIIYYTSGEIITVYYFDNDYIDIVTRLNNILAIQIL
jgi:hypothetical protein